MTCLACGLVCLHFIDIILLLTFSLSPVFTKCKDNLENGRRLENLSWRLWYRESLIEKAKEQHVRTPIPIQQRRTTLPTRRQPQHRLHVPYHKHHGL